MFVKKSKTGQKTYTGLCIDLLDKLQEEMKFRYTIEESPGNVYGAPDVFTGEWSGMVRHLIDNVSLAFPFPFLDIRRCDIPCCVAESNFRLFDITLGNCLFQISYPWVYGCSIFWTVVN